MTKQKMTKKIAQNVATMTATELRLTANATQEELNSRRETWVQEMYERFCAKERHSMACSIYLCKPDEFFTTDRVVVTCFKDKDRSKASVGVARLSPGDRYDYRIGAAIAFARAMGEEVPDLF